MGTVYKDLRQPPAALGEAEAAVIYRNLCSYSHKPLPNESLTRLRGTNLPTQSQSVVQMWAYAFYAVSTVILDMLIAEHPMCLFPVHQYRKFGFNPPVGVFFDKSNFVPLRRSLDESVTEYKDFYRSQQEVADLLSFFNGRGDIPLAEILKTWTKEDPKGENPDESLEKKVEVRFMLMKAEVRAFNWAFAYGQDFERPELREFVNRVRATVVH